ncbi:tRNA (uracil-5-)-methyltransferase homolog A isoform X2 [Rhodnius prolixus]
MDNAVSDLEVKSCVDTSLSNNAENKSNTNVEDPYAYIEKNGFTSEKFKIEIRGLPKYYGMGELRKLLNVKLKLNCNKVKSPGNRSKWVYACFRSEEEKGVALEKLSGLVWKGSKLQTKIADPAPDPFIKRKKEENDGKFNKKIKIENREQQIEAIENSTTPLCHMPYEEQLKQKWDDARRTLLNLGVKLVKSNPQLNDWIERQKSLNEGLPCKLHEVKALPDACNYYRNKCEFTIGKDELTGESAIGFRLGTYASGSIGIAPIDSLKIIPEIMLKTSKIFEKFVRESKYEVFSPDTLKGYWRQLTVRVGTQTNQLMVIVGFHPQELAEEEVIKVKEDVKQFFMEGEGSKLKVNSLYFQFLSRRSKNSEAQQCTLLAGEPYIEEVMCNLRFKISPESFFQINTRCAERLIETVKDLATINKDTTVLDVCCGTGTIGLCLAKDSNKVLGIEIVSKAVQDARENASKNSVDNSEFFCGKADEIITSVVKRVKEDKLVAILDPPRAGLHQKAIVMLRRTENLDRLVFLSCDCKSALQNFIDLGRAKSKTLFGEPFVPVAAVPVDMFPHTNHYELVIYFERLDLAKSKRFMDSVDSSEKMETNESSCCKEQVSNESLENADS